MAALCDSRNMNTQISPLGSALGTPLSSAALKVMLLGAGELGKEVIIALQRLGVEVIAVDRYANAPGTAGRASRARDQHGGCRGAARADRGRAAGDRRARDRSDRHRCAGSRRARRSRARRADRARSTADDESRRDSQTGGRNAWIADLALSLRRFVGRAACRRAGDWAAVHHQAGDVVVGQGPEPHRRGRSDRSRVALRAMPPDVWRSAESSWKA